MPRRLDLPDPFGPQVTGDPAEADTHNFYKVERWTENDQIAAMIYAGNRLERARAIFENERKRRPAASRSGSGRAFWRNGRRISRRRQRGGRNDRSCLSLNF
jgi:hypothetical protein